MTSFEESGTQQAPDPIAAAALALITATGLTVLTLLLYPAAWFAEQYIMVAGDEWSAWAWPSVTAGHAASVFLPSLIGLALTRQSRRYRSIFQTWLLAAIFMLLTLPVRWAGISDSQLTAVLQIISLLLYLVFLIFLRRQAARPLTGLMDKGYGPAMLLGGLFLLPWVLLGALGSWLDTTLNLAVALLFGVAAAQTLELYLRPGLRETSAKHTNNIALGGLGTAVMLGSMAPALGNNGQQLMLMLVLPILGWLIFAVGYTSHWRAAALLTALVTAGPILFIDPDELALVLNLGTRDVGTYAIFATLTNLMTALLVTQIYLALHRRTIGNGRRAASWTAGAIWIGLLALYGFFGQPGWHGERLFVVMADQPTFSAATAIDDPIEKRSFVFQTAVDHANTTQARLRQSLDRIGINYTAYYLVNAIEVDAGPLVRWWLEGQPEIDRILDSPELRPLPQPIPISQGSMAAPTEPLTNLTSIGVLEAWETYGVRGAGIIIGHSDSGVDGNHPELAAQYRGDPNSDLAGGDYNWLDPWYHTTDPVDIGGHGTHTLGSVLGRTVGVAPEATWIGCVNLARNLANPAYYLECLQFLLAPYPQDGDALRDGRPELGAHVLNNSWGCPELEGCDPNALITAAEGLRAAGVFVVASAGNEGDSCETIAHPIALYDSVFTVGAVDDDGLIARFSSRGPVMSDGSGRTKPDIMAPGVNVLSAFPGNTYEALSGTSMAGPHIAGIVALIWSANPNLIGQIEVTEQILIDTATPYDVATHGVPVCGESGQTPNNATGYGLINVQAAIRAAINR